MALPRVNEVLKFSLTIPSTGQTVRYRPYLVKEEKVLLQAFESRDTQAAVAAMTDTLSACIEGEVDVSSLATFDLEYMFLKVRSKSVGETSDILIRCKDTECGHNNEMSIDLEDVKVALSDTDNIVDITDTIKVEMRYPNYSTITSLNLDEESVEGALGIVAKCIEAVHTDEERIDTSVLAPHEITDFLDSMTATQLKLLTTYVENMPALKHEVKFQCQKCGIDNELVLKGLSDFF